MDLPYHTPLSRAQQAAAGVDPAASVAVLDRVHHDDLDTLMHVNNVRYFVWFERLRMRFCDLFDLGRIDDPAGPRVVIRSGHMHWIEELRMGDDYIATAQCVAFRRTSLTLVQNIWAAGRKRAEFTCVMVFLTQDGRNRLPIPDTVRARLEREGARSETSP